MAKNNTAQDMWYLKAACRGPNQVFFPPSHLERRKHKRLREQRAKVICEGCNVKVECLDFAIKINEQHGIWGGLTEKERKPLLIKNKADSRENLKSA